MQSPPAESSSHHQGGPSKLEPREEGFMAKMGTYEEQKRRLQDERKREYNEMLQVSASGGRAVERRTVNRGDSHSGSIPSTAVSKLRQFRSPHLCLCLSEETLKAGGPFCLVSMPGEVKDPTQGVNV